MNTQDFMRMAGNRICIQLPSGAKLSIVTGENAYCEPRETTREPYTHVEVGILSGKHPASWRNYSDGPDSYVYGYLPVELLSDFFTVNLLP
jgi:hypothetical protein